MNIITEKKYRNLPNVLAYIFLFVFLASFFMPIFSVKAECFTGQYNDDGSCNTDAGNSSPADNTPTKTTTTGTNTNNSNLTGTTTNNSNLTGTTTNNNSNLTGTTTNNGNLTGTTTNPSSGAGAGVNINSKIDNPLGSNITDLPTFINVIISFVLLIGIPIIVLAVIYAGFMFVTAAGNSEKLKKAKTTLLYTLIGAALLLGAFVIAKAIQSTVNCLGDNTTCSQIKS